MSVDEIRMAVDRITKIEPTLSGREVQFVLCYLRLEHDVLAKISDVVIMRAIDGMRRAPAGFNEWLAEYFNVSLGVSRF